MRRARIGRATAAALVLAAGLTVAASAMTMAEDDVRMQVFLRSGNLMTTTNGLSFQIVVEVESSTGALQPITIRIALPEGLRWGTDGPDPGEGCTGTSPAVCATEMKPNEVGTVGSGFVWDVVAERTGIYEVTASVTTTEPDPDASNNTHTFRFEVAQPSAGGGPGGGGGAGGSVTASAVELSPAPIKAGSVVTASVRIVLGGAPVRPTRVTCAGTIGGAKVRGVPKAVRGRASCVYRTPAAARGKTLRGAVAFTARGERYVRRFAARLR